MSVFDSLKAQKDGIIERQEAERKIRIYTAATQLAMKLGQVTGEDSRYFVTLTQLEEILEATCSAH